MRRFFVQFLSLEKVKAKYKRAGASYGDAVSYVPIMGKCIGFDQRREEFEFWEDEWVRRGQIPVPFDNFVRYGGGYVEELEWS